MILTFGLNPPIFLFRKHVIIITPCYNEHMENHDIFPGRGAKFLLALALVLGITSLGMNLLSHALEVQPEKQETEEESSFWIEPETTNVINVLASGVFPASPRQEFDGVFQGLGTLINTYDVSTVSVHGTVGSEVSLNAADTLISSGFGFFGLAYPGAHSAGKQAIEQAMNYWNNQSVRTSGTNTSTDAQNLLRMAEVNGISVIYLSYTDVLTEDLPENEQYLVNVYNDEKTPQFVAQAADLADLVIVSIVWEGEQGAFPSDRQKQIAQALAQADASIIIGYSEHAVQPVAWIDDTLVFYSLGDLYSEEEEVTDRIGALGAVTVKETVSAERSRVELTNPKVDLIVSLKEENAENHVVFLKQAGDAIPSWQELYQGYSETLHRMDDSIRIGGLN